MHILIFFIVLVILILVHEFGHFIVAKKSGVRVDEFGVGFPPKLYGKKFGETEYTINALPIGGFVRIWGEDPTEENSSGPDSERSFVTQPRYIQAAILVAGVAMNILLAFVLYVAAFMIGVPTALDEGVVYAESEVQNIELMVSGVVANTPATDTLNVGDKIIGLSRSESVLSDADVLLPSKVSDFIAMSEGEEVTFDLMRQGEVVSVSIVPEKGVIEDEPERAAAGFAMSLVGIQQLSIGEAIVEAFTYTTDGLVAIVVGLGTLLNQAIHGTADYSQIAGPVGIVGLVGDAAAIGFTMLLTFTAFISLNLAVINLLPIPALDGGRLVFVLIESITRKPIKAIWATRMNQVGFFFLLGLMALVTFNDVVNLL